MVAMSSNRCAERPWTEFQKADAAQLPYPDDSSTRLSPRRFMNMSWTSRPRIQAVAGRGLTIRERISIPMFNPEFEDNTFGIGMLEMMGSFAVGRKGASQEEATAWFAGFESLGEQGKFFSVLIATCLTQRRLSGYSPPLI